MSSEVGEPADRINESCFQKSRELGKLVSQNHI